MLKQLPTEAALTVIAAKLEAELKPYQLQGFYQELALHCAVRGMTDLYKFFSEKSDTAANVHARNGSNEILGDIRVQLEQLVNRSPS